MGPSWVGTPVFGGVLLGLCVLLGVLGPSSAWAAPPVSAGPAQVDQADQATGEVADPDPEVAVLRGRVLEAGGAREPVAAAVVMVVDAPPDVRVGKPARTPLDPDQVAWMRRAETDLDGYFELPDVPVGKLRVVIIAGGFARFEQWVALEAEAAEAGRSRPRPLLRLYLVSDVDSSFRTEVVSEREPDPEPVADHILDGQRVRHYAGGGDDPLIAALNLPGIARTPAGLGLISFRGANPTWTGYFLDGHPIPRAFHTVPVASVVSPTMIDRIELNPGNYPANYGGFGGGMVQLFSRRGEGDGIHGSAHVDLFDLGASISAPVGPGNLHFGIRRSHVDAVLGVAGSVIEASTGQSSAISGLLVPRFWDYLGRLDLPLPMAGHSLTIRALGAGDVLSGSFGGNDGLRFSASFHRFDLDYRIERGGWKLLLSPSLRLDQSTIESGAKLHRRAQVVSARVSAERRVRPWVTLSFGTDLFYERFDRRTEIDDDGLSFDPEADTEPFGGEKLRLALFFAPRFQFGRWTVVPGLRGTLFNYAGVNRARFDPRLDVRVQVHPKVELSAQVGLFAVPLVLRSASSRTGLIPRLAPWGEGFIDIPVYLITFFDPRIESEALDGAFGISEVLQASMGLSASLPWALGLNFNAYWREGFSDTIEGTRYDAFGAPVEIEVEVRRRRGMGMELLLSRPLGEHLDGWLGYTLSWSRIEDSSAQGLEPIAWLPALFDQRHNFVALLSAGLPRGFRLGARFRVVSGNPEEPILGATSQVGRDNRWVLSPIRGVRGESYRPVFHQLDLRLDKSWVLRKTTVNAYIDIQNIYDNRYPEAYVYRSDWRERGAVVGLPIYPSLGMQVDF